MKKPTHTKMQLQSANFSSGSLQVVEKLKKAGFAAYVVGGAVRDLLLGRNPKDFDVATNATPEEIKQHFRTARIVGKRFKIVHIRSGREVVEVTTFRRDQGLNAPNKFHRATKSGRLLRDNVFGTLQQDARRRDLTINALYCDPVDGAIIDELDGIDDVHNKIIRVIGNPEERYREDPVRMLRAVRFAAYLDFNLEFETEIAISKARHLLRDIPPARLFDEWIKLFMTGCSLKTFRLLIHYDLLAPLMGEAISYASEDTDPQNQQVNALSNTDQRIAAQKPVTPAFLIAALLWPTVKKRSQQLELFGQSEIQAILSSGQQIILETSQHMAIPKRFSLAIRDIWDLQPRLALMQNKKSRDLLAHRWFRAAFDLRILLEQNSKMGDECSRFWMRQQQRHPELVGSASKISGNRFKRNTRGQYRSKTNG